MNFFAEQARVRRNSRRLVALFALAVIMVTLAVDAVVVFTGLGGGENAGWPFDPWRMAMVSAGVLGLIGLASLGRTLSLRGGGSTVARGLGATPVPPDTTDPALRRLRNVIEEVAIASGVPVPDIYLLETEAGINAFAAGYTPADAAVCVTQGCLDKLNRDELQGVIAHEFSHVLNGDMRLNIRLIGLLFGILVIGILGRILMYSGGRVRSRRGNTAYVALIGIGLLVIGYIGFFFGRLIQAAVARSRESLADASAVQFTRQTTGIAGALKKIAALAEGSRLEAQQRQEVAHMLFGEGSAYSALFATHPPLLQRIRALEPNFNPEELETIERAWQQPRRAQDPDDPHASIAGFAPATMAGMAAAAGTRASTALPGADARFRLQGGEVTQQVGQPGPDDYHAAGTLHGALPDALRRRVADADGAITVVLALTLDGEDSIRERQLGQIGEAMGEDVRAGVAAVAPEVARLHAMQRLPLAALAFPQLKRRPRPQLDTLVNLLGTLVRADGRVALSEYCLTRLVRMQVIDALDPARGFRPGSFKLTQCREELRDLFALLAHYGHEDEQAARRAFQLGMDEVLPRATPLYAYPEQWQAALDQALDRLKRLNPEAKELTLRGMTRAIAEDGVVSVNEAEMLRVVCAALQCPLPAMIGDAIGA